MVEEQNKDVPKEQESLSEPSIQVEIVGCSERNEITDEQGDCGKLTEENAYQEEEKITEVLIPRKKKKRTANEDTVVSFRRERDKVRQRLARQNESDEKRKLRLEKDRIRKRMSRQVEDDFEKLRRRDKDRERRAMKRKHEKESLHTKNELNNDANDRVSMVNIGSKIVIKDTQIDRECLDDNIEVTVEVADDDSFRDGRAVQDISENSKVVDIKNIVVLSVEEAKSEDGTDDLSEKDGKVVQVISENSKVVDNDNTVGLSVGEAKSEDGTDDLTEKDNDNNELNRSNSLEKTERNVKEEITSKCV